jgi:hypothetical protein
MVKKVLHIFTQFYKNSGSEMLEMMYAQCLKKWLGRQGSNLRMAASKAAALPLGDAPASQ